LGSNDFGAKPSHQQHELNKIHHQAQHRSGNGGQFGSKRASTDENFSGAPAAVHCSVIKSNVDQPRDTGFVGDRRKSVHDNNQEDSHFVGAASRRSVQPQPHPNELNDEHISRIIDGFVHSQRVNWAELHSLQVKTMIFLVGIHLTSPKF